MSVVVWVPVLWASDKVMVEVMALVWVEGWGQLWVEGWGQVWVLALVQV